MLCDFIVEGQGWYRCSNCNIQLRSNDGQPPVFPCRNTTFKRPNESKPSFINKVKNFAKATSEHISQGMKLASDETISKRYSICESCEFFNNYSCDKCGCPVFQHRKYISKLSWESEKCPEGKW